MRTATIAATLVAAWLVGPAPAADHPIDGVKLLLKRTQSGREKLVFTSKDATFLFPAPGGADDPVTGTPGGAVVELFSPAEPGGAALAAPAAAGVPGWTVSTDGERFRFVHHDAPDAS